MRKERSYGVDRAPQRPEMAKMMETQWRWSNKVTDSKTNRSRDFDKEVKDKRRSRLESGKRILSG